MPRARPDRQGRFKLSIRDPEGCKHEADGPGSDGFLFALHMLVAYEGSPKDPGDDKLHQLGKAYLEEAAQTIARLRAK